MVWDSNVDVCSNFSETSRLAMGPTELVLNGHRGFFPEIRRQGLEFCIWPPLVQRLRSKWSYIYTPLYMPSWRATEKLYLLPPLSGIFLLCLSNCWLEVITRNVVHTGCLASFSSNKCWDFPTFEAAHAARLQAQQFSSFEINLFVWNQSQYFSKLFVRELKIM